MKNIIFLSSAALLFIGCSTVNVRELDKEYAQPKTSGYSSMQAECKDAELEQYMQKAINRELEKQKIYGDDLKIYCEIAHYDEGNRALRYFVGFGAGSATSTIRNNLIDTENNETLSTIETQATLSMGVFGGDAKQTISDSAKKVVDYFKKKFLKNEK